MLMRAVGRIQYYKICLLYIRLEMGGISIYCVCEQDRFRENRKDSLNNTALCRQCLKVYYTIMHMGHSKQSKRKFCNG